MSRPDLDNLFRALTARPNFAELAPSELVPLAGKGLAHAHVRVKGKSVLLRLPRLRAGEDANERLTREAEMFARAAPSDATPRLLGTIAPGELVPSGALIVDDISGTAPRLPQDLPALGNALGSIHKMKVPDAAARAPLASPSNPVAATVATIEGNLALADKAGLDPKAKIAFGQEIAWAKEFATNNDKRFQGMTRSLCLYDTHPGNFIAAPGGRAYFVDIDKCLYSFAGLDLAHLCARPALAWDPDCAASLSPADIDAFVRAWALRVGDALARETTSAFRPFRRLVWLRTTSQFLRFRVEGTHKGLDGRYADHAEKAIAAALDPKTIADQRKDWG
jgi:hypothetical protein